MTAYMKALNPGTWLLNCMNSQFFDNGMSALFNVTDCGKSVDLPSVDGGETRIYCIAADEVIWNYGPSGENNIDGASLTWPKRYINHDLNVSAFPLIFFIFDFRVLGALFQRKKEKNIYIFFKPIVFKFFFLTAGVMS